MSTRISALLLCGVLVPVALFQLALALGLPWGEFAMGGEQTGSFSPEMRVGAVMQLPLIAVVCALVLARAGLTLESWHENSRILIWGVVALFAISLVMNLQGGPAERMIWAPIAVVLLATGLHVAIGRPSVTGKA